MEHRIKIYCYCQKTYSKYYFTPVTLLISGFSVLQVQGPCPFRIEVTNSLVQPRPPTVPVCRENNLAMNRSGGSKIGTCSPNASCGLFGPITYDVGGRTSTGKQRAPINTTPPLAVSVAKSHDLGKYLGASSNLLPPSKRFKVYAEATCGYI